MTLIKDVTNETTRFDLTMYTAPTLRRAAKSGLFTNVVHAAFKIKANASVNARCKDFDWMRYLENVEVLSVDYVIPDDDKVEDLGEVDGKPKYGIKDGVCDGVVFDMDDFSTLTKLRELCIHGSVGKRKFAPMSFEYLKIKGKLENMRVESVEDQKFVSIAEKASPWRQHRGVFSYNGSYFGLFGDNDWVVGATYYVHETPDGPTDCTIFQ